MAWAWAAPAVFAVAGLIWIRRVQKKGRVDDGDDQDGPCAPLVSYVDLGGEGEAVRAAPPPAAGGGAALARVLRTRSALPPAPAPAPLDASPWRWVASPEGLAEAAARLGGCPAVALDLEWSAPAEGGGGEPPGGRTCLLQLSDGAEDFLVDALALREHIGPVLGPLLAGEGTLKVLHGGAGDAQRLAADFGVRVAHLFDTERACRALGAGPRALGALLAEHCGVAKDRRFAVADWRQRPLPPAQVAYARADVHFLLHVAGRLVAQLDAAAGGPASPASLQPGSLLWLAVQHSQALSAAAGRAPRPPRPPRAPAPRRRPGELPAALRASLAARFGARKAPYEGHRMLGADGSLLCYTDRKRLLWYIAKGLGERVVEGGDGDDAGAPASECRRLTVRLRFQHTVRDQAAGAEAFYSASRANVCVGCGEAHAPAAGAAAAAGAGGTCLRFRVVPQCYRRALPEALKSHRSHDVVLLCVACHEVAGAALEQLKRELAAELGVPLHPPLLLLAGDGAAGGGEAQQPAWHKGPQAATVRRAAQALQGQGARMPPARRAELEAVVAAGLGLPAGAAVCAADLWRAQLAGHRRGARRRVLRGWAAAGADLPADLAAEASLGEPGGGAGGDARALKAIEGGHAWHGREVVAALRARGDAALLDLLRRCRAAFVAAVRPSHLPRSWSVDHDAPRAFGGHSVYAGGGAAG